MSAAAGKGYGLVIGMVVLAAVFIGFLSTTGFFALPEPPAIKSAEIYPEQASPNSVMLITANVEDRQSISSVEASVDDERIELTLIEGNSNNGKYQGSWIVRGTPGRKEIILTATNVMNKKASISVQSEVV